jgi:hypothetical protein
VDVVELVWRTSDRLTHRDGDERWLGLWGAHRETCWGLFQEPADPRSPGMERTPVPSVLDDADNITKLSGRLMPVDSLQLLKEARSQKLLGTSAAAGGWSKLREYTRESSDLQRDITRNKTLLGLSVQVRVRARQPGR